MMTKEEVTSIVTYCQMHKVSYSKRLKELGVPTWKFYEYKSRYASEPQAGKAGFVQITDGGTYVPVARLESTRGAIVYSLIGACKSAGGAPRVWMVDVLCKLPYYQRDGKDVAELLPRAWKEWHPGNNFLLNHTNLFRYVLILLQSLLYYKKKQLYNHNIKNL